MEKKYFDFTLQKERNETMAICFSLEKWRLISSICQDKTRCEKSVGKNEKLTILKEGVFKIYCKLLKMINCIICEKCESHVVDDSIKTEHLIIDEIINEL